MPNSQDIRTIQMRVLEVEAEHRELDQLIEAMESDPAHDELGLRRLKKRKLQLKDQVALLQSQLAPNEHA